MTRPYSSKSIVELETEFERAQDEADRVALKNLLQELDHRTTPRARVLREALSKFLGAPQERKTKKSRASESERQSPPPPPRPRAKQPEFLPTDEQQEAVDQFRKGGSLKINAFAGSGKTSTLQLIAHGTPKRGQYIAFNKAIVRDANEKFPNTVNCSTLHALALKATPSKYKADRDKAFGKVNAKKLAEIPKLKRWSIDRKHALEPRSQGYLILDSLRRFMHSADPEPAAHHIPRHGSLLAAPDAVIKAVNDFALHGARHVWKRMIDEKDPMPLGHDGYLKLWAQNNPTIASDYILLDEAQDTNPVVLDVLRRQPAQMIYVGDKYQQIYEWRGAVNAMEKIDTDASTFLTMSFRFGSSIAQAASKVLRHLGERRPIKGNPAVTSQIGPVTPRTILARTNASTVTAIIETLDAQKQPHLVGGTAEIMEMLRGVQDLKEGRQSTVPDFFGFENWQEVVEFAKSGEGDHLQTFVNLVETRGERQLMWALNRTVDEEKCDVVISTAHKAKGREWSTVRLMDDFLRSGSNKAKKSPQVENGHDPAELRLFYVALTRARNAIEVPETVLHLLRG
ncbi:MAG: ATP-dependent helicase [Xanthobacteraceae bacterium]|nr:ATP-dependent helicase [Xanthobacteraceae bacterium]